MMNNAVHVVLVIANLMNSDGVLNKETAARIDLAVKVFCDTGADCLMLIGWDYRPDSDLAICDAMAAYVLSETQVSKDKIILNRYSRDTVGDAIFSRIQLEQIFTNFELSIVSTDYHVHRVNEIFSRIYGPRYNLSIYGSDSDLVELKQSSERESLVAFNKTFDGVKAGDIVSFRDRLLATHPFYNGACFPDRPVPETALDFMYVQ